MSEFEVGDAVWVKTNAIWDGSAGLALGFINYTGSSGSSNGYMCCLFCEDYASGHIDRDISHCDIAARATHHDFTHYVGANWATQFRQDMPIRFAEDLEEGEHNTLSTPASPYAGIRSVVQDSVMTIRLGGKDLEEGEGDE